MEVMKKRSNSNESAVTTDIGYTDMLFFDNEIVHAALLSSFILNAAVAVFGIVANILNITVFIHQGFKETINISLTLLAVSDLASLVCLFWLSVCHYPEFEYFASSKFSAFQVAYVTGGIPRTYFTLIGSWITTFIATERCISVVRPLQVKFLFTRKRLVILLVLTFPLAFTPTLLLYITTRLDWTYDVKRNATYVGLVFMENRASFDFVASTVSVLMTSTTFALVCVCTIIINITMARQRRWRTGHKSSSNPLQNLSASNNIDTDTAASKEPEPGKILNSSKSKADVQSQRKSKVSAKDNKATKTVTMIAAIFIVCYLPSTINRLTMTFFPEYTKNGRYGILFEICWSFCFMAEAVSSGANIFVYTTTSSRFSVTMRSLFGCHKIDRENKADSRSRY